jgi:hypothetical protein
MESLILLACPVGMGLMMWFMMKGQKTGPTPRVTDTPPSLEVLRADRDRIDAELRRHDVDLTPGSPDAGDGAVAGRPS